MVETLLSHGYSKGYRIQAHSTPFSVQKQLPFDGIHWVITVMCTVDPRLSGPHLSSCLDYPDWVLLKLCVLLEYFSGALHIKVWVSIIWTFQLSKHILVPTRPDKRGSTVYYIHQKPLFTLSYRWNIVHK